MRVCQYLHLSAIVTNFHVRRSVFPLALVLAFVANSLGQSGPFRHGDVLPAWVPGTLDIHQIVTGRGNAAFMMFPDGTTLLLDAGDAGGVLGLAHRVIFSFGERERRFFGGGGAGRGLE